MSNFESRFDGECTDGDAPYAWLDEWLCEYVDGTMDPALEAVFEEYVDANPELKQHVQNLQETRRLLGGCCAPPTAARKAHARKAQARVCSKVECEMLRSQPDLTDVARQRPMATVGIVSSVAVALVVGFFAGTLFLGTGPAPGTPAGASSASGVERFSPPRLAGPSDRAPRPITLQPIVQRSFAPSDVSIDTTGRAHSLSNGGALMTRP